MQEVRGFEAGPESLTSPASPVLRQDYKHEVCPPQPGYLPQTFCHVSQNAAWCIEKEGCNPPCFLTLISTCNLRYFDHRIIDRVTWSESWMWSNRGYQFTAHKGFQWSSTSCNWTARIHDRVHSLCETYLLLLPCGGWGGTECATRGCPHLPGCHIQWHLPVDMNVTHTEMYLFPSLFSASCTLTKCHINWGNVNVREKELFL